MQRTVEERDKLILANKGLVYSIASTFWRKARSRNVGEFDDLVQVGYMALLRASENFDESRGFKFSTFAVRAIKNKLISFINRGGVVAVPTNKANMQRASKAYYCCGRLEYQALTRMFEHPESRFAGDSFLYTNILEKMTCEDKDELVFKELREKVSKLRPQYRHVLYHRFWLGRELQAIGDDLGITREAVRIREKYALKALRAFYKDAIEAELVDH